MEDTQIVDLYFARSEQAIVETDRKYGPYCYQVAYNVLGCQEDAEESVSDTYMTAWNRIPPTRPNALGAYLGKISRFLAIDRWRSQRAARRGGGEMPLALEELSFCVAGGQGPEERYQAQETVRALNRFLEALPETERNVFLRRYWYLDSIGAIAARFGFTESKTTSLLFRLRKKLRAYLEKEGIL